MVSGNWVMMMMMTIPNQMMINEGSEKKWEEIYLINDYSSESNSNDNDMSNEGKKQPVCVIEVVVMSE